MQKKINGIPEKEHEKILDKILSIWSKSPV